MKKGTIILKNFIGIDIYKKTLDYCILDLKSNVIKQDKIENTSIAIKSLLTEIKKQKMNLKDTPILPNCSYVCILLYL